MRPFEKRQSREFSIARNISPPHSQLYLLLNPDNWPYTFFGGGEEGAPYCVIVHEHEKVS